MITIQMTDGETISGKTDLDVVRALRANSFAPNDTVKGYMRGASLRALKQCGRRPSTRSARHFVADLLALGLATPVTG